MGISCSNWLVWVLVASSLACIRSLRFITRTIGQGNLFLRTWLVDDDLSKLPCVLYYADVQQIVASWRKSTSDPYYSDKLVMDTEILSLLYSEQTHPIFITMMIKKNLLR